MLRQPNNFNGAYEHTHLSCPHCGKEISSVTLSKFQVYEVKVATWLQGETAPTGEMDYDVCNCKPFPELTFQVKHSTLGMPKKSHGHAYLMWTWAHHAMRGDAPDYFILCGISESGVDNWFILSRDEFIKHGGSNGKGGFILQGRPNRFVIRGANHRSAGYSYENTIWRYHCPDPSEMIDAILAKQALSRQLELL